jgi:hypothetical protein
MIRQKVRLTDCAAAVAVIVFTVLVSSIEGRKRDAIYAAQQISSLLSTQREISIQGIPLNSVEQYGNGCRVGQIRHDAALLPSHGRSFPSPIPTIVVALH